MRGNPGGESLAAVGKGSPGAPARAAGPILLDPARRARVIVCLEGLPGRQARPPFLTLVLTLTLVEFLVTFSGENDTPFDVRFAWAVDRPVVGSKEVDPFAGESLPVLKEAARELRARLPEEDVRFRGNVIRLHREGNLGSGEFTVAGSIVGDPDGKLRRVTISLAESDYEEAIAAHRSYEDVEMLGSLVQRGNRTSLLQAREFIRHAELT